MTRVGPGGRPLIVAVFGGGKRRPEAHPCARRFGAAITASPRRHLLLTGGTVADDHSVEGCAIEGAGSSPRIGVARASKVDFDDADPARFDLESDLENKRNYVEAHLSDAAVALRGDGGTLAEVVSALVLRRPVALVGGHWRNTLGLDAHGRVTNWASMVEEVHGKFASPPSANTSLDARLKRQISASAASRLGPHLVFEECEPEAVLSWLEDQVRLHGANGTFPVRIAGHAEAARAYRRWLVACETRRGT